MALIPRRDQLPIPPKTAKVYNTVCQYCNVGGAATRFTSGLWASRAAPSRGQNALRPGPQPSPSPPWPGRATRRPCTPSPWGKDGQQYHVVIVPAKGQPHQPGQLLHPRRHQRPHRLEPGPGAPRIASPTPSCGWGTSSRPSPGRDALTLMGLLIKGIRDRDGNDDNIAVKCYDHGGSGQGFEDNYGAGKLFFSALSVKHIAIHNRPAYNSEVWGSRERGVPRAELRRFRRPPRRHHRPLGSQPLRDGHGLLRGAHAPPTSKGPPSRRKQQAYEKGEPAEAGRLIVIDPRKTSSYTVAETVAKDRVMLIRPNLGTDYILANAIARVVWERGYYDMAYLQARTDMGLFEEYKKKSLKLDVPYGEFMGPGWSGSPGCPGPRLSRPPTGSPSPRPGALSGAPSPSTRRASSGT
jgi:arsenite oxidase large subunit